MSNSSPLHHITTPARHLQSGRREAVAPPTQTAEFALAGVTGPPRIRAKLNRLARTGRDHLYPSAPTRWGPLFAEGRPPPADHH